MSDLNLQFARGGAEFTVELFNILSAKGLKKNIVFSPFSIQTCLALAFAGADGVTADEIAKAMKFVSNNPSEVAATIQYVLEKYKNSGLLKIANKVYVKDGASLKTEYATTTKENYHAEAEQINFSQNVAAAKIMNDWVEGKTAGKIKEIVQAGLLSSDTCLVLLNALHFKSDWAKKFNEKRTEEGDFWISKDQSVKVDYMNQRALVGFAHFDELNCKALEMAYKDCDLSMFVLLPNERDGLKDLVEKLKDINLVDLGAKTHSVEIEIKFPKFKFDYSVELTEALQELGITQAFEHGADFSKILQNSGQISVSNVLHKASIEVNEEGCEAAAATAMIMQLRCALVHTEEFNADHPFLYIIWNKKNILFAGTFVNAS